MIAIGVTRKCRVALVRIDKGKITYRLRSDQSIQAAAVEYVMKREAFGKPIVEQPVVRHRLAICGAQVESLDAWIQQFVFQMTKLPKSTVSHPSFVSSFSCKDAHNAYAGRR